MFTPSISTIVAQSLTTVCHPKLKPRSLTDIGTMDLNRQHHFNNLEKHRRIWRNNKSTGILDPVWPRQPEMDTFRKVAIHFLPPDFADAHISIFSKGDFHRVYLLKSRSTTAEYMMRVALPVDPFFKTESEVATMEYVRKHSSIPVPKFIAYAASASTKLGFEWILMERIHGVPLDTVWDRMPFEAKMELTAELARSLKQLWERPFPLLGSIYFTELWNQVG